jgi:hypothetical protein
VRLTSLPAQARLALVWYGLVATHPSFLPSCYYNLLCILHLAVCRPFCPPRFLCIWPCCPSPRAFERPLRLAAARTAAKTPILVLSHDIRAYPEQDHSLRSPQRTPGLPAGRPLSPDHYRFLSVANLPDSSALAITTSSLCRTPETMPAGPSDFRRRNRGFLGFDSSALPSQDRQVCCRYTTVDALSVR